MKKQNYVIPVLEEISICSGNNLLASSPEDYNTKDYEWSEDGYLF